MALQLRYCMLHSAQARNGELAVLTWDFSFDSMTLPSILHNRMGGNPLLLYTLEALCVQNSCRQMIG